MDGPVSVCVCYSSFSDMGWTAVHVINPCAKNDGRWTCAVLWVGCLATHTTQSGLHTAASVLSAAGGSSQLPTGAKPGRVWCIVGTGMHAKLWHSGQKHVSWQCLLCHPTQNWCLCLCLCLHCCLGMQVIDFGTAGFCEPGQHLHSKVGTAR